MQEPARRDRTLVGVLLILLFAITYLDRVCISVAGPRIQNELHIDAIGWGWVTGIFTFAYGLFEIPSGALADRIGPRKVLTRIVLWWSAFTALTGTMTSFVPLLATRFLFGAGEAGAFPSSSVVIARWFRPTQRATLSGVTLMASQIGGAMAPLLVVPIQARYGWRASFFVFGGMGVLWAAVWYGWFRDTPGKEPASAARAHTIPWRALFASRSVVALSVVAFCYVYVYNFFQTWLHTFLVRGRGFSENGLLLSSLPYVVAAAANLGGGAASDALVRAVGPRRGRKTIGAAALAVAGLGTVAAMATPDPYVTLVLLTVVYGAITFQQSGVFGVCLDLGQKHAGAVVGLMNTTAQLGGLAGSVVYGYLADRFGYNAPFLPMAILLLMGAALWTRIDASEAVLE